MESWKTLLEIWKRKLTLNLEVSLMKEIVEEEKQELGVLVEQKQGLKEKNPSGLKGV